MKALIDYSLTYYPQELMNKEDEIKINSEDSFPPIFGSWNKLYGFVLLTLAALVFFFYIFTKAFE